MKQKFIIPEFIRRKIDQIVKITYNRREKKAKIKISLSISLMVFPWRSVLFSCLRFAWNHSTGFTGTEEVTNVGPSSLKFFNSWRLLVNVLSFVFYVNKFINHNLWFFIKTLFRKNDLYVTMNLQKAFVINYYELG